MSAKKLRLYNSLTRKKEIFKPQDSSQVKMYTCGPTVYGPSHLGHARTNTTFDLIKRILALNGYKVKHVLNITDIHDSMIEQAGKEKTSIQELGDHYFDLFRQDLDALNVLPPDIFPRVTSHIKEIIAMIKVLIEKGYAYEEGGSVYYDVSKFKDYGKLSGIKLGAQKSGTRVAADKYEKEEAQDFALWKAAEEGEEAVGAVWDSPWGEGRPGWHIECSVMAKKHLGETIDIHAGGSDIKFPHHENEIAQSEAANGEKFANYWVHCGMLTVDGQKMSKSLGNYVEFREVADKGFNPLAFRYLCLTAHYRNELNFTWEGLAAAQRALDRLYSAVSLWGPPASKAPEKYAKAFAAAINDDLDMPKALTALWEVVKDDSLSGAEKHRAVLEMDKVFGLSLDRVVRLEISDEAEKLIAARERARGEGDWARADVLRGQLEKLGYLVEDTSEGPITKRVGRVA